VSDCVTVQITQPNITASVNTANVSANVQAASVAVDVQTAAVTANVETANITVNIAGCVCSGSGTSQSNAFTGTAGENIAAGNMIYVADDGLLYLATAGDPDHEAIGIALAAIDEGDSGTVYLGPQIVTGFDGLTPGQRFFLSADGGGQFDAQMPNAGPAIVQQVGHAISDTKIFFNPQSSIFMVGDVLAGDYRITESGDYRIVESAANQRITETGDNRITEDGDNRITE